MTSETKRGLAERVGLLRDIDPLELVKNLSGGERQALKIVRAIYHKADIIVLDEPIRALSVRERRNIRNLVLDLNSKGISFIYITHNIHEIFSIADRFVVLDRGIKILDIKKQDIDIETLETVIAEGKAGSLQGQAKKEGLRWAR